MNDEGLSSLSFFSSERSSSLFSMAKVRKGDFGTRVPKCFDIILISSNLTNSQISNWKLLKLSKKSPQKPLEFWHMFWHTCARFLIYLCQTLRIRCLSKAFNKILQNSIGKYYIFCIGKCTFNDITVELCNKFREYLLGARQLKHTNQKLSRNAAAAYWRNFRAMLKKAYLEKYLKENLNDYLETIDEDDVHKEFLTAM